jgi:alpha-tubulin suppressor-like RCC1 family protein
MEDFANVIKYTKINGRDILEGDETFFINVMGMEVDWIKKLKYELRNVKNPTCKDVKLYGWGSNKNGQLGLNSDKTFIKTPTLITLPDLTNENDYINKIYCGKTFSLLLTNYGEIFITGNYNPKIVQVNETAGTNTNTNSKKTSNKFIPTANLHRWVNITREICFDPLIKPK